MKKKKCRRLFAGALILCMLFLSASMAAESNDEIIINVPQAVLTQIIQEMLPIELPEKKYISGSLWIESIQKLVLGDNNISFFVRLRGKDVSLTTEVGSSPLVLNIGNVDLNFNCAAAFRYEAQQGILYLKPIITGKEKTETALGLLFNALVGEEEVPLEVDTIRPLVTEFGGQVFQVDMNITQVYAKEGVIYIAVRPIASKRPDTAVERQ